jgi:hypothetical protein
MATTLTPSNTSPQWLPDDDTYALRMAKTEVDKAAEQFEQEKARLYRQDGTPKYAPKEHQERLAALLEPVNQATEKAKRTAEAVRERCDQEATVQNADPLLRLTNPEEQAEVTYKQGLIEDDVQKTPLLTLAQRLEAIALHGSKVEQLLYARYARRRVEDERRKAANTRQTPEGLGAAFRAAAALEQKNVDPKLQAQLKRVEERRKLATDVHIHANGRLAAVNGREQQMRQAMVNRYR